MIACDPAVVRQMLNHVEVTSEQHWASAIGKQVHFSEWTLYGVFLDEVTGLPANAFVSDQPLCLGDWSTKFTKDEADEFLNNLGPDDVAAMISSKSGTPISVRRAAFADWRARWANQLMVFATFAMYLPV
jgi:hypothetical protein